MFWGSAVMILDFISLHLIFLDKMRQVTFTFCEQLPVPLSTTIIFISPLVYIPYTADIEMMIILLFCTANNLLHIGPTDLNQYCASSNSNTFRWKRFIRISAEVSPNIVCGRPSHYWFDYSQASPRENFEFLCYLKCIFVHFKRVLQ